MLLYNAIGRHIPGIITVMESDNDNATRRIVTWDRMSGFSHIHITKMFEITITTAKDTGRKQTKQNTTQKTTKMRNNKMLDITICITISIKLKAKQYKKAKTKTTKIQIHINKRK
jgi:transposase